MGEHIRSYSTEEQGTHLTHLADEVRNLVEVFVLFLDGHLHLERHLIAEKIGSALLNTEEGSTTLASAHIRDFDPIIAIFKLAQTWLKRNFGLRTAEVKLVDDRLNERRHQPESRSLGAEAVGQKC